MSLDELTITLSDKDGRVSAETLRTALENALNMLRGIEASIVSSGVEVRWDVIRVRMRSPLQMTFSPKVKVKGRERPTIGRKIVRACLRSVEEIERGASVAHDFSDEVLDATRKLVKNASSDGTSITFASNGENKIKLTEKTVKHIDEIVSRARLYMDFLTIEGRLDVVSGHDHDSFFIWETLTNHKIECLVSEDQISKALLLFKKRVAVTGRVRYRNHVPYRIDVEEPVRSMRDTNELPQPRDIGPVNITDGLSSEEHVRRMRNA